MSCLIIQAEWFKPPRRDFYSQVRKRKQDKWGISSFYPLCRRNTADICFRLSGKEDLTQERQKQKQQKSCEGVGYVLKFDNSFFTKAGDAHIERAYPPSTMGFDFYRKKVTFKEGISIRTMIAIQYDNRKCQEVYLLMS